MAAPASVEPVRISLGTHYTGLRILKADSRPSRATLMLTKRMLIAQFPAFVANSVLWSLFSLLPSWSRLVEWSSNAWIFVPCFISVNLCTAIPYRHS